MIARCADGKARAALLPDLADGSRTAALALASGLTARTGADGARTVSGTLSPVLGAASADLLVVPFTDGDDEAWAVLEASHLETTPLPSLDVTRAVARVRADAAVLPQDAVLTGLSRDLVSGVAAVLIGAEATGVAAWCVAAAADYAKVREQFGRPIGRFQGVKHKCARMAIALEQARAVVWDAARAADDAGPSAGFAASVAGLVAPDTALSCARDCIQVHGGIGFTWEHDAHRYLRRASTLRVLAGPAASRAAEVADSALKGGRRPVEIELGPGDDHGLRERVRAEVAELAAITDSGERSAAMGEGGWVMPHLPRPWGRDASPLEQVLIHQELRRARVKGPMLAIGAWVVPSLAGYGTPEQQERFLRPTLRGDLMWCQLFSEPGAGSDLASLSMRAERVEGGYRLTGQKIWTSAAHLAQWGICLARTDSEVPERRADERAEPSTASREAPAPSAAERSEKASVARRTDKHDGITYFVVDMSAPGLDVRPLRELTGDTLFNEVFFDEVFVPDDCVIGEPGQGWKVARNTLSNERVALSGGSGLGAGVPELLNFCAEDPGRVADQATRVEIGRLVAQGQAIELLGLRVTLKQLSGTEPGAESSVRKLLGVEFNQRVADYIWEHQGDAAVCEDTSAGTGVWARFMLFGRSMTIYGGTTEVQLNIIGERLLGLPRDPEA